MVCGGSGFVWRDDGVVGWAMDGTEVANELELVGDNGLVVPAVVVCRVADTVDCCGEVDMKVPLVKEKVIAFTGPAAS